MALDNVSVFFGKWRATGVNVQVPQYELEVRVIGTKANGQQADITRTVRFPNVLAQFAADDLKDIMQNLLIQAVRNELDNTP